MPLYDFACDNGHKFERMVALRDFEVVQICYCGADSSRLISKPMFTVDHTGYDCPITGKWIGSKHQHRENLAIHGCRVLETGEKDRNEADRKEADEKLDKILDKAVEQQFDAMPSDKKESLHNELINGKLDLAVTRGTA